MTVGQKIKKLRTDKGLTQKDLADQLCVAFQTVSKWESDTNEPDITTLKSIAKFFNCSIDYLLSDEEAISAETNNNDNHVVHETIIIHHHDLHVCEKCGKDIPEEDLVAEDITQRVRHGRGSRSVKIGETYFHKDCYELVKKERIEAKERAKIAHAYVARKKCFGWGIASGVVALIIALVLFLCNTKYVHPALGVLYSIIAGYGVFSMIYCILSGSYIGDVFLSCASFSIKFPALIFSWGFDGFMWLIAMKVLFAIAGFLVGVAALLFAVAFSSLLGMVSFPFVLLHNIKTCYEDAIR